MLADYPPMCKMIDKGIITLLNSDAVNFLPDIDIHVFHDCHSIADQVVVVKNAAPVNAEDPHTIVNEQGQRITITPSGKTPSVTKKYLIAGDIANRPANLVGRGSQLFPTLAWFAWGQRQESTAI